MEKVEFFTRLPKPRLTEEPVSKVVEEALKPYLQHMEGLKIDLSISTDKTVIRIDKHLLVRAFSILIENALDALPEGGRVSVGNEIKDNQCRIFVTDTGSGIASKYLPHIFNPFFRTKPDGVGIDLAVVKRIMDSHGGSVEVESTPGKGTAFSLLFPLERRRSVRTRRLGDVD